MRRIHLSLCLVAATLAGTALTSAYGQPSSAGSTASVWFGVQDYSRFKVGGEQASKGEVSVATLDAPTGKTEGLRFTVRERCDDPIAVQAGAVNSLPLTARDTLFAHFFMRTTSSEEESGEGKVQLILENNKTYEKSVQYPANTANDWKEFNVPFTAKESYQPGEARVIFRLGYRRQTVEIAGFEIRNYESSTAVSALPMTFPDLHYAGMEADAPWRAEADARIEKIRKSPLTIQVVDKKGAPVTRAAVEIQQTRHAFSFGAAVSAKVLVDSFSGADTHFSDVVRENFNLVTFENDLKWQRWEQNRDLPLEAARWCKEHDIALRGHNMIWPGWRFLPARLKELQGKPDELRQAILHHVEDVGTALAPYAVLWDVVNEPFKNHDLMDILGNGILTEIFQKAKESAPDARLFLNDYGIVTGNGSDKAHQDHFEQTIQTLLDQHAPLEGIGIQGHFGQEFTPPTRIYEILDRYARFHLPLQMTEFTAQADDRQLDATVMRDVMTIFFSHPAVNAFIFWGFYDGKGFPHKETLYNADGQLSPVGKMYKELVFHRWWTHETATTGVDGTARVSGFHGRYEILVKHDGVVTKQVVELKPGGSTLKVVLGQ